MDGNLNKSAWKQMENSWAKALQGSPPKQVEVEINLIYSQASKRAEKFEVFYDLDGMEEFIEFQNMPGGQ